MVNHPYGAIGATAVGATLVTMFVTLSAAVAVMQATEAACKIVRKMTDEEADKFWDKFSC